MSVQLLLAMLRSPASTGALLPSSRALADAMARAATGADLVVELGAGTGPVTHALLHRHQGVPLIVVEWQASLARRLKVRYPLADVRQASAKHVVDSLIDKPGRVILVSSLPFRSLPKDVAAETVDSICRFLTDNPCRKLVQFTYQPRAPFAAPRNLRWKRTSVVWRNTPPAGIWELQEKS
jgi:phospholipid N-methyltransferase